MSAKELVLASNNPGKLREFQSLFAQDGITIINQGALGVEPCPEPFETFVENCLAKARHAARVTGRAAMADDSGICVDALRGQPGVHSARFAGEPKSDEANNALLIQKLKGVTNRRGHYTCVLVAVRSADDPEPLIADARWFGEIVDQPQGQGGFGYDPYFYIPSEGKTVAELDPSVKNRLSHRGQALVKLREKIRESWGW